MKRKTKKPKMERRWVVLERFAWGWGWECVTHRLFASKKAADEYIDDFPSHKGSHVVRAIMVPKVTR